MKIVQSVLLLIIIGTIQAKPLDDGDAGIAAVDGDDSEKKDKADDQATTADSSLSAAADVPPAPADVGDVPDAAALEKKSDGDNADAKPDPGPTPTPTPGRTTPKPTEEADKSDKIVGGDEPTPAPSTKKPATSPAPTSTAPKPSTVQPTVIKKETVPSTPKPTSLATTVASSTRRKTTAATTHASTLASTHRPTKPPPTKAVVIPKQEEQIQQEKEEAEARSKVLRVDKYGQTVEKSENNTMKMNGTTFRVAVRLLDEKYSEDLNYQKNPVFQSLKKNVMTAVTSVYDGYHDFKQIAIIGFTETPINDSDADKRDAIGGNSVIADFYLRFFTYGKHLRKLTDAIKSEKLGTMSVSPRFVKAYTAEPKGRVCTPDCRIKCYSYCDDGCCVLNLVPHVETPHVDLLSNQQWSSAPIAPHSQPIDEPIACRGPTCLPRQASHGMKPLGSPLGGLENTLMGSQGGISDLQSMMGQNMMSQRGPAIGADPLSVIPNHPQAGKNCNGDKRCESKLFGNKRVSISCQGNSCSRTILKAQGPFNMNIGRSDIESFPDSYNSPVSSSELATSTSLMQHSPMTLMDENASLQSRSGILNEPCIGRDCQSPTIHMVGDISQRSGCSESNNPNCQFIDPGPLQGLDAQSLNLPQRQRGLREPEQIKLSSSAQRMNVGQNRQCPEICAQSCLNSCPSSCCVDSQQTAPSSMFFGPNNMCGGVHGSC